MERVVFSIHENYVSVRHCMGQGQGLGQAHGGEKGCWRRVWSGCGSTTK